MEWRANQNSVKKAYYLKRKVAIQIHWSPFPLVIDQTLSSHRTLPVQLQVNALQKTQSSLRIKKEALDTFLEGLGDDVVVHFTPARNMRKIRIFGTSSLSLPPSLIKCALHTTHKTNLQPHRLPASAQGG